MIDKRVYIIGILTVLGFVATIIRESGSRKTENSYSAPLASRPDISNEHIALIADTTLKILGITKENIRPIKNRNDIKVLYPDGFDVLNFLRAINDSLDEYNVKVVSVDNAKDKSSVVQIKKDDIVLKGFIFQKEPVRKKGVSPSVPKKQPR